MLSWGARTDLPRAQHLHVKVSGVEAGGGASRESASRWEEQGAGVPSPPSNLSLCSLNISVKELPSLWVPQGGAG